MEKPRRGEASPSPYRSKRLYCINGLWYFDTREGEQYGPFEDEYEAKAELALHINLADAAGLTDQDRRAEELPQVDDQVEILCIIETVSGQEVLCLPARIGHIQSTGLGVVFTDQQPEIKKQLARYISNDGQHDSGDELESPGAEVPTLVLKKDNVTDDFLFEGSLSCSGAGKGNDSQISGPGKDIGKPVARRGASQPENPLPSAHAKNRLVTKPVNHTVQPSNNDTSQDRSMRNKSSYMRFMIPAVGAILLLAVLFDVKEVKNELEDQQAIFSQTIELMKNGVYDQRNFAALETSINALASQVRALSSESGESQRNEVKYTELPKPVVATNADARVDATKGRVPGKIRTRPWVINLVTLQNRESVDRLLRKAEQLAIPIEVKPINNGEKSLWQLRVNGFASETEASEYARSVEKQLDLPQAWISSSR